MNWNNCLMKKLIASRSVLLMVGCYDSYSVPIVFQIYILKIS